VRILHLVLSPRLSGAEVLAKDLAIYQQRSGEAVGVTALTPPQDDFARLHDELLSAGVRCLLPLHAAGLPGRLWGLFRSVRTFRPDVIFAHATIPAFYVRSLPITVPIVYVMHSATNDFERGLFRTVERALSRRAEAIIAVSPENIRDYVAAVRRHPCLELIPNGVDVARFSGQRPACRCAKTRLIVQIGRYTSVKNQLLTVHAFAELIEQVPDARLVLCGVIEDDAYHLAVTDLVSRLGLDNQVTVEGPRSDVAELLADATAFAMPSRSEGHSIAFLEALASGIPVVASDIPPFQFAAHYAAVTLLDPQSTRDYANGLIAAMNQQRVHRPLIGLTLADTAERYLAVARRVTRREGEMCAG
jgi:glycosyltransferase involved in cell wall biosynthesis